MFRSLHDHHQAYLRIKLIGWNILIPLASTQHNLQEMYLLLCIQY